MARYFGLDGFLIKVAIINLGVIFCFSFLYVQRNFNYKW